MKPNRPGSKTLGKSPIANPIPKQDSPKKAFLNETDNDRSNSPKKFANSSRTATYAYGQRKESQDNSKPHSNYSEKTTISKVQPTPKSPKKSISQNPKESHLAGLLLRKASIDNKSPSPSSYRPSHKQSLNDIYSETNTNISPVSTYNRYDFPTGPDGDQSSRITSLFTEGTQAAKLRADAQSIREKQRGHIKASHSLSLKQSPTKAASGNKISACPACESMKDEMEKQRLYYQQEIRELEVKLEDSISNYHVLQAEMQRLDSKTKAIIKDAAVLIEKKNKEIAELIKQREESNKFNLCGPDTSQVHPGLLLNTPESTQNHQLSHSVLKNVSESSFVKESITSDVNQRRDFFPRANEESIVNEAILKDFYAQILQEKRNNAELKGIISKLKARVKELSEESGKIATNYSSHSELPLSQKPSQSLLRIQIDSQNEITELKEAYQQTVQSVFEMYKREKSKNQNLELKMQQLTKESICISLASEPVAERTVDNIFEAGSHRRNYSLDKQPKYEQDRPNSEIKYEKEAKHTKSKSMEFTSRQSNNIALRTVNADFTDCLVVEDSTVNDSHKNTLETGTLREPDEITDFNSQIVINEQMMKDNKELKLSIERLNNEIFGLKAQCENYLTEISKLKKESENQIQLAAGLTERIELLSQENLELKEKLEALQALRDGTTHHQQLDNRPSDNSEEEINKLQESLQNQKELHADEIQNLSTQINTLKARAETFESMTNDLQLKLAAKEASLVKGRLANELKEKELERLQGEMDDLELKIGDKEKRINELTLELEELEKVLALREDVIAQYSKERDELRKELQSIKEAVSECDSSNKDLEKRYHEPQQSLDGKNENISKEKHSKSALTLTAIEDECK